MNQKKHLTILEFSRLTGIKRENLRFYDRIGLLSPESRGENGYRRYARRQLSSAYLIGSLRLLGVGLDDIRRYSAGRSPEKMLALFAQQEAFIQAEIAKLRETSEIMEQYAGMAREALCHNGEEFLLDERRRERIFLCPAPPGGMSGDDREVYAFEYAKKQGINPGCPMGVMIPQEMLVPGELAAEYQYYLKAGSRGNTWKPAGLYAVAYGRSAPDHAEAVYGKLLDFIRDQGVRPAGCAYAEFLLDELALQDSEQYSIRIEIPVDSGEC